MSGLVGKADILGKQAFELGSYFAVASSCLLPLFRAEALNRLSLLLYVLVNLSYCRDDHWQCFPSAFHIWSWLNPYSLYTSVT